MTRGFMLFECMLVVVIIMFIFSFGFIAHTSCKRGSFAGNVALIGLLLHAASSRAQCVRERQMIICNHSLRGSEIMFNNQTYPLCQEYFFGVLPDVWGPPSRPEKRVINPITFHKNTLIAYEDGTLQAGTIYITDGKNQYAITTPVSPFLHVRAYRYRDKKWEKYC